MNGVFFKTQYNHDTALEGHQIMEQVSFPDTMCVQSQAEDADINVILKRFGVTGQMPVNPRVPQYGDFSEVLDYRSALDAVRAADAAFNELPADARKFFDNDPQKLLEFAMVPDNIPKLKAMGLAKEDGSVRGIQTAGKDAGGKGEASGGGAGGQSSSAAGGSEAAGGGK